VGYTLGSEGRKLSTGLGIRYGLFNLDYAYALLRKSWETRYDFGGSEILKDPIDEVDFQIDNWLRQLISGFLQSLPRAIEAQFLPK
jgi:hypothetical protein